jgi:hypothetical protein
MERDLPDQDIAARKALFQSGWLWRALLAGTFALALGSQAMAADEEDEESFEEKFMNSLLGTNKPVIDYRERSPLVVPPAATLPAPENAQATSNPAWPKDADNMRARKTKRADQYERNKYRDYSGRPLLPNEVEGKGRGAYERAATDSRQNTDNASGRPLSPYELGEKGNVFSSIFSSKERTESAVFPGEPVRGSLTEPPRGYLTPSPNYPYGLSPSKETAAPVVVDRAVGRE